MRLEFNGETTDCGIKPRDRMRMKDTEKKFLLWVN